MRLGPAGAAGLVIGAAAAVWVFADADWAALGRALAAVGWAGFAAVCLFRFVPIAFDAMGWRALASPPLAGPLHMTRLRWTGESVNTLLPVAQVGGDVVRARLLGVHAGTRAPAAASTAADFALGLVAQTMFIVAALAMFAAALGPGEIGAQALAGTAFTAVIGVGAMFMIRGRTVTRLAAVARRALPGDWSEKALTGAETFTGLIRETMADRRRVFLCLAWRFAGWFVRSGEPYLILWFSGLPVTVFAAIVIEAAAAAARSAAFFVPGALGVYEGGILATSLALGLDAETGLALALVKRGREIGVCGPGLLDWWLLERRGT
ncbi:MAG: lysylphosphatidylglycerol synthase domain-containing protein [Rhodospirillales bacterium]